MRSDIVLAVHGGAGIILRNDLSSELEQQYRDALKHALQAGYDVLIGQAGKGISTSSNVAVLAAEAAVRSLEDCPLFNAGRGSVYSHDGTIRMDASIMGCHLEDSQEPNFVAKPHPQAGAVAGIRNIKNPITLARAVMERTPHVMLIGAGAEEFARSLQSLGVVEYQDDKYFHTERRKLQWQHVQQKEKEQKKQLNSQENDTFNIQSNQPMMVQLDHFSSLGEEENENPLYHGINEYKFGTVGSVALYHPQLFPSQEKIIGVAHQPQLASATSTGGMTNQRYHRVGDSPIIGAGTFANSLCAVSCTGHGEWFLRCVAAHDVVKRLEYKYSNDTDRGFALEKAVNDVVFGTLLGDSENGVKGGDGGLIALDKHGNFVARMNCPGMYHGWVYSNGEMGTRIFSDENEERAN